MIIAALAGLDLKLHLTRFLERSLGVILMYHAIDDPQGYAGRPPVTRADLTDQLSLLARRYEFTALRDLVDRPGQGKRVALTFDDGHRSFMDVALPLLLEHAAPATVFVSSKLLGTHAFLSPKDVRDLARLPGIEIGNHTATHRDLSAELSPAVLMREIVGGRQDLEDLVGARISSFAYPYGRVSAASMDLVRRSHTRAVTVMPGVIWRNTDPYTLHRVGATGIPLSRFAFDLTDLRQLPSSYLGYDRHGRRGWRLPWSEVSAA